MIVVDDAAMSAGEVDCVDAYWRAANYLSVGQIYGRPSTMADDRAAHAERLDRTA